MKRLHLKAAAAILLLIAAGCGSPKPYDGVVRQPKQTIDIYEAGQVPPRPYRVIMSFSNNGGPGDEAKFQREYVAKAKKLGADAVIFKPAQNGGWSFSGFGGGSNAAFGAVAVVYQ
jgi:hypothetical protein